MASPTYSTNVTTSTIQNRPDAATEAFRNAIYPGLVGLGGRTPTVYGAKWNDKGGEKLYNPDGTPKLDPNNGEQMYEGAFDRDPNVPLTAKTNKDIEDANAAVRAGQGAGLADVGRGRTNIGAASGMDISGAGAPAFDQAGGAYGRAAGMDVFGAGLPAFDQAGGAYGRAAGMDIYGAGRGNFDRAGDSYSDANQMDIYGAGAGDYNRASGFYDQAAAGRSGLAGQGQFDAATGMYNRAAGTDTAGQYQRYGDAATNLYGQSTDALGLSSASPYLQAAGQSSAQNIGQYMNPYNEQVIKRIGELGARNLSENILPSISSDFIKAGGYGSTRQRDLIGRAARDSLDSTLAQQAQALQQGYGQALTASAGDLSRYGNLAGTAGQLGTQQQQLLQGAASGISGVGQAGAGFSAADAARQLQAGQGLSEIGRANIQASQDDYARQLAAGQGYANVAAGRSNAMQANAANKVAVGAGQANLGTSRGNLMQANAANQVAVGAGQANLGTSRGNLMQANQAGQIAVGAGQAGLGTARGTLMRENQAGQLAAGQANLNLGQTTQKMGLTDAAALQSVGEGTYGREQAGIDAGRRLVTEQAAAPFYNVGQASNIAAGAPAGGTSGVSATSAPGGSTAGQIAGLAATAVGAYGALKAKGGAIKKGSLKKASYGKLPKRGLSMFARAA